jgi:manganese transport system ATP-binding protein
MLSPDPPATERLAAQGVTVAYHGVPVVDDVSFSLPAGCLCGLVGMNGAGKSTLLQALGGSQPLAAGSVRIDGLPPARAQRLQRLASVPQSERVDWDFPVRVRDVVMMGRYGRMNLLRWPSAADRQAVEQALERVDLAPLAERPIGALSGGQRKRVFLARALAQEATVLLLDEPFNGVDQPTEQLILSVLRERCAAGATALLATHDLETIPDVCDRVLLLNRRLVAFGPTAEVFTPAHLQRTFAAASTTP